MSSPRNQPCPCGSGKKYKHCHLGRPFRPGADVSVQHRSRVTLAAAIEIFGFRRGRTWTDFKQNISGDQIRQFYEVQAEMWRPDTDWAAIMPRPDSKLRGLYLGDIRPEFTLRNLIRFCLYTDQLFVVNPFPNPWVLRPEYNPIENPDQYKADTLNLIHFLMSVAPWINAGILTLIPDPGELNVALKWETACLAKARIGDQKPDERDLEDTYAHGREDILRAILSLPEKQFFRQLDQMGEDIGKVYTEAEKREFFKIAKAKLRSDPIAWEGPLGADFRTGQLMPFRSGANLETALLICNLTGAFPYTNIHTKWRELTEAREQLTETARTWTPLTKAFQELEFRFLDNVNPEFAQSLRQDGRLESFRALLRRIGKGATEITDMVSLNDFVRDCNGDLTTEYGKAKAEWEKIDQSFFKGAAAGVGAALATGHMFPDIGWLTTATLSTLAQLGYRFLKQSSFRKENPMSVFIDLSRKEPPGLKLY